MTGEKNRNGGQSGLERWLAFSAGGRFVPVGGQE